MTHLHTIVDLIEHPTYPAQKWEREDIPQPGGRTALMLRRRVGDLRELAMIMFDRTGRVMNTYVESKLNNAFTATLNVVDIAPGERNKLQRTIDALQTDRHMDRETVRVHLTEDHGAPRHAAHAAVYGGGTTAGDLIVALVDMSTGISTEHPHLMSRGTRKLIEDAKGTVPA